MSRQYQHYLCPLIFVLTDYLAIVTAEKIALWIRNWNVVYTIPGAYIYIWVPLVFFVFIIQTHIYTKMQPILDSFRKLFYAVLYGMVSCILLLFVFKESIAVSRVYAGLFCILVLLLIFLARYVLRTILKRGHFFYEPVILIGAGRTAEHVLRFFHGDLGYRYDVTGIIDDHPISERISQRFLLYGKMKDAEAIVRDSGIQNVIITAPGLKKEALQDLIQKIQPYVRNIAFVPDLNRTAMAGIETQTLFSEEILMLTMKNNLARRWNRVIKRIFDLVCTILGSILLSPLLLGLTLLVAVTNRGHVIFAHQRVGRNGRLFPCYKFQTMIPNAQEALKKYLAENPEARKEWEANFKLEHDPRVTKLGAFLRKTSLDELPQLWNVIKGDMSLVGPRPIVTKEIERYGDYFREYSMVLPGITGMWQASGRSDVTYEERVAMDTWYVRNWSIWVDLMYLFKTITVVFSRKGAY
ncbi:undecaprenyl-phosphate galactose phosphotransferase WbaP [Mitsuokella jalaludinii]|uniref:undecaprenyl-phosphate galactose phosphotransferase WbaP n=1 Tax=Mitsuokella jalaludinii TaxID=187979 RepID=UPI00307D0BCD